MGKRGFIVAGTGAVVLAAATLAAYWLWAAGQVRTAIAEWREAQRAAGYEVAYDGPDIAGFPIRLSVQLTAPRIAAPQGWRWSGAAIAGEAAFWQPLLLRLALPLSQELAGQWRGQDWSLRLDAARADGLVRLDRRGQAATATVELADVAIREAGGWSARAGFVRNTLARPPVAPGADPVVRLEGAIADLTLDQAPPPLPATIDRVAYAADLIGPLPPGTPAATLAAWRDGGGLLEIRNLTFVWGTLDVRAEGTATLDEALRPQGAFSARVAGLPEILDALVAQGVLQPSAAAALRFAVLTFSEGRDGTSRPIVRLPVTVQDGTVFLGPVALGRVDPVL